MQHVCCKNIKIKKLILKLDFFFITGKLNLFYSEALPPRVPVILQDELFDEHELGGHGGAHKQPVLLREDLNGGGGRNGGSLLRENEALLQQVTIKVQTISE